MKKINLVLLFLILFQMFCFGQSINILDQNNGFKKFKFGTNKSAIKELKLYTTKNNLNGVTSYLYTGTDITFFNTVPIEDIVLTFYNNKLYQIAVTFGTIYSEYTKSQFDLVHSNLKNNFGNDYADAKSNMSDILNGHIWDGKKIRLESIRVQQSEKDGTRNPKFNYIQGYLLFTEKNIHKEQQKSEI